MGTWRYWWRHLLRVEALKTPNPKQIYPVCTAGNGFCPPENCGGPWGFMKTKEEFFLADVLERLVSMLRDDNVDIDREEVREMLIWLSVYQNRFDRIRVNKHLRQYATGDRKSLFFEQVIV
jgi:Plasmid pRiA4b ORF-3-like protein